MGSLKYYNINFSSDKTTMDGKPIEKAQKRDIIRNNLLSMEKRGKELNKEEIDFIEGNIISYREVEKGVLNVLISQASKEADAKGMARFLKLATFSARIDDSEGNVEIDSEEIEWLRKAFEEMKERPIFWLKCIGLFKQLVELRDKDEKKEDTKEESEKK